MSYGGHHGQEDAGFDYAVDQAPFAYKFPQHEQADHMDDQSHAPLMTQDQQDLMNNFFEHPDTALSNNNDDTPFNFRGFELSGDNTMNAMGMPMPHGMNFAAGTSGGNMHMSAPSIPRNANHMAMPHLSQNDVSSGYDSFFHDYTRNNNSYMQHPVTHDNQAATALMNMSSHSQENSHPALASELGGSSWGNINLGNPSNFTGDQLNSPMVSGGPSSGSTTTPLTPTSTQQYPRPGRAASFAQSQYPQHNLMQQAAQSGAYQHIRHPSLQIGNSASHAFANSQAQSWQMPQRASGQDYSAQRRPPLIQYGSDQNFGQQGYQGTSYTAAEEKSTNLLNVPLATQVARDSSVPFASAQQASGMGGGQPQRHSAPNNLQQLSNAAVQFDALTTSNQVSPHVTHQFQPLYPMNNVAGSQSRKRRISEVEDNGNEVTQTGLRAASANSSNAPRRGLVVPKQEPTDELEQSTWATPPGSANKRRKSTAQVINSTASASPSTPIEAPHKASSSSKKRRSEAKARQNLSDTQKRNNHIASEQKRRDAMKTNYDVLNQYVPTLHGGQHGLSRSEILQHSADWLAALTAGNKAVMDAFALDINDLSEVESDGDD